MLIRAALNLLLVLALVAGGLGPVSAEHRMPASSAQQDVSDSPCHGEPAPEPAKERPADCCRDTACTCDCLHVSPMLVESAPKSPVVPNDTVGPPMGDITSPMPARRPPLRPPIA